jgi:hypothetical protein
VEDYDEDYPAEEDIEMAEAIARPGHHVIDLFTAVIYEFSIYARVFVRIGLKGLSGTNTLAYCTKNRKLREKNVL